jgi:hypothetical protein
MTNRPGSKGMDAFGPVLARYYGLIKEFGRGRRRV